jgi:hypothetical protein
LKPGWPGNRANRKTVMGQLILSVMQSGAGVIEVASLEVTAVISPHQIIVQLLDACLKAGVILKELSVAFSEDP